MPRGNGALLAVACLWAIGALALSSCAGPSSALAAYHLRNAEYGFDWIYPHTVELEDGFFWGRLTPRSPMEVRVALAQHAAGDLNGDGAYDAALHEASRYVARRGERLAFTGADHRLVWEWFRRQGTDRTAQRVGDAGYRLRQARRLADDDPAPFSDTAGEARRLVALARQAIDDLRTRP